MRKNLFLLLFLFLFLPTSYAEIVEITKIEHKRDRGYDYLDVYTTGLTEAKGLMLEDKLYIEFPGASFSKSLKIERRKSTRIRRIDTMMKDKNTARIIVYLKKEIDYDVVNVFGRDKSVIEIGDQMENFSAYQFAWEKKEVKRKGKPLRPVKLQPLVSMQPLPLKGKTIILDPGHGGDDPGALCESSMPEKVLTLKTAQVTARLLREEGATVYLTRNEDRRSSLQDICVFVNKTKADIFISIHYNAINNPRIAGTETYYYNRISRDFAEKMHEAIVLGIRRKDHGLKKKPFYVVKNINIPSVLLEPVYLTNPDENELAKSDSFRIKLAESLVSGVKEYVRSKLH